MSGSERLICRGTHLGSGQFSHEPAGFVEAALGNGETGLRCPECGTIVYTTDTDH